MSLLMEALRKAEEAKNKTARQKADKQNTADSGRGSDAPDTPVDESAVPERIEFSQEPRFSLRNMEPEPADEDPADDDAGDEYAAAEYEADYQAGDDGDDGDYEEDIDEDGDELLAFEESDTSEQDYDPRLAEEELVRFEENLARRQTTGNTGGSDSNQESVGRLYTARTLFQGKRKPQARQRTLLAALLLLLLPLLGGLYWYLSAGSNPYSNVTPLTASQSATLQADPQAEPAAQAPASPETVSTEAPAAAESLIAADTADAVQTEPETPAPAVQAAADNDSAEPAAPQPAPVIAAANPPNTTPAAAQGNISLTRSTVARPVINPDLQLAYQAFRNADLQTARGYYQQVLQADANNRDALLGLAMIHRQQGNPALARDLYSRLLQLNPRDPLARTGLLDLSQNQDFLTRESELRALLAQHPQVAPLAFALGNLYASRQRWQEAQSAYFEAMRIAGVSEQNISPDYAFNLAVSLERLNQPRAAHDYYQQALMLAQQAPAGFSMELLQSRLNQLQEVLP